MESKTIRFEKGEENDMERLWFLTDPTFNENFIYKAFSGSTYVCTKSFTVQINIIEDEEKELFDPRCIHENRSILGICERCGEGTTKLIEDEES